VIVNGEVEMASAARHESVKRLSAGNVFGDISLLSQLPYALTAIALTPTDVLMLDRDTLNELGGYYPNIPFALTRYFALRLGHERGFWREETF
jgi:CRP-like cAMP-binding protein